MKKLVILAAVALALLLGTNATALSSALGDLQDTTVDCIAGGAAEVIAPGGVGASRAATICVKNRSATCVSLGGSGVVHPGPIVIGQGCEDGMMICLDTRRMWCDAASGTVNVKIGWGAQ